MARQEHITAEEQIFTGTDHVIQFTVLNTSDAAVDITGWALKWTLFLKGSRVTMPIKLTKTTGGSGVALTTPASGICQVTIADTDTDSTWATSNNINYSYELRRTDAGSETVLAYGDFVLLGSPNS